MAARADAIVTASESYVEVLSRRFHGASVSVVLNTPALSPPMTSDRIQRELGLTDDTRTVLYQGIMNAGRGLHQLVESAAYLSGAVRLVMIGDGMLLPSLRRLVADHDLDQRVSFVGLVPQAELHEWTSSSDIGVLILEPINLSKRLASANKIFEYMAAGVPILATDLPENRRVISACDCGWLISEDTPEEIAAAISRILADPEEMKRRGRNGRQWAERRYNWGVESQSVVDVIERLVQDRKGSA